MTRRNLQGRVRSVSRHDRLNIVTEAIALSHGGWTAKGEIPEIAGTYGFSPRAVE